MAGGQQRSNGVGTQTYGVGEPGVEEETVGTLREQAADNIRQAIMLLESTDPVPESAPGPEQTEAGRNSQALSLMKAALPWLEDAK